MSCNSYGLIGCIGGYGGKSHIYSGKSESPLSYEGIQDIYFSNIELPVLSSHYMQNGQISVQYIPSYTNNSRDNNPVDYSPKPMLSARELGFSYTPKLDLLLTYVAESKKSEQNQKYSPNKFQTQFTQKETNLHKERDELEQLIAKEKMVMLNAN